MIILMIICEFTKSFLMQKETPQVGVPISHAIFTIQANCKQNLSTITKRDFLVNRIGFRLVEAEELKNELLCFAELLPSKRAAQQQRGFRAAINFDHRNPGQTKGRPLSYDEEPIARTDLRTIV